jgi:hypothetical protein
MDWGEINSWLGLVANAGVVAGLVLVAIQIRQNTEITKAQVSNEWFMADMQLELAMMGENPAQSWTKAVFSPDDLDRHDAVILDRYFNYGLVQLQRLQRMHELGMADTQWTERIGYLRWHLGNEVGRRWWTHFKRGFTPEFAAMVERILADGDSDPNKAALEAILTKGGAAGERGSA